jgi:hypothetical protein
MITRGIPQESEIGLAMICPLKEPSLQSNSSRIQAENEDPIDEKGTLSNQELQL